MEILFRHPSFMDFANVVVSAFYGNSLYTSMPLGCVCGTSIFANAERKVNSISTERCLLVFGVVVYGEEIR